MDSTNLLRAVVAFFAIIDPVGNLLIFHTLSEQFDKRGRIGMALVSVVVAFLALVLFVVGGTTVLAYLQISFASFQIAAGLLLVPAAFRLVEQGQPFALEGSDDNVGPFQLAVAPLAIPLLAGPGALATAVSFASSSGRGTTLAAAALVLLLSSILFLLGSAIFRLLGAAILRVLSRLVGILLMAIAINLIVEGLASVFK